MNAPAHLTLEQVRTYVRGALHPSTLVGIDDHLEGCAACRAALARESDASFGAEAFGRALAAPEPRPESPHVTFELLMAAVDGTLGGADREWVDAHVTLCVMCAEELRDLERFAGVAPGRPAHVARPVAPAVTAAKAPATIVASRTLPPRPPLVHVDVSDEPPPGFGEKPPARVPRWTWALVGVASVALLEMWSC